MAARFQINRIVSLVFVFVLLASVGITLPTNASEPTPEQANSPMVVRIYVNDTAHLNAIAGQLDIWESHPDQLYVIAYVQPSQYHWLKSLGFRVEFDAEKTAQMSNPEAVLDPRFAYFDDGNPNSNDNYMVDFMEGINTSYPEIVEMIDIGNAWAGLHMGYHRDIWVLRITNEDPAYGAIEDKPVFYLHGGIHAREVVIPELLIRYVKYLTSGYDDLGGYGIDPDVTWLVNHQVAYVLLTSNPDGHVVNEENTSAWWRKNVDNDDGFTSSDSWGIDLNRNHSFKWACCGGSSGDPCSDTYRGPARGSEPETQAIQDHIMSVIDDQNGPNGDDELPPAAPDTTTGLLISMHSYSNLTLFPWGASNTLPDPANLAQLSTLGHKFAYYTGYTTFSIWYDTDGGTVDWAYGKLGIPAYTFEVGPQDGTCGSFFPAYECIDGAPGYSENFWAENRPAFIYGHKIANTPYITSYGPDSQALMVSPSTTPAGTPVDLTANLQDHRCCGNPVGPIAAAEYFIDAPGEDGTGIPMDPVDGAWGETNEDGTATVDTSSLAPGQHYLLVHAKNSTNYWGPFTAVFLNITPGDVPPVASFDAPASAGMGESIQFTDTSIGQPEEWLWDFGDGGSSTLQNPVYTYETTGTFTVSLTVTNTFGFDSVSAPIEILPVDVSEVALTLQTTGTLFPRQVIDFNAVITPADATPPYQYSINFGDGTSAITGTIDVTSALFEHIFTEPGMYPVRIKVWNNEMLPGEAASDILLIMIANTSDLYLPYISR